MIEKDKNQMLSAHAALFSVGLIYGLNYSIAKLIMNGGYIQPSGFIFCRVAFGSLFFVLVFFFRQGKFKINLSDVPRFIACGLFGVAVNQLMFFRGLEITTPINASLIMTSTPVLVLSLSSILGIERLIFRKVLGLIIGIVGAIYLITSGFDFTHFSQTNLGDLYVLINASAFALYLILSKPLLKTYDPIQVVLVCFAIGLIFVSPFGIPELVDVKWRSFNLNVWLSFGFVLLFTTGLAYLFNAFALKRVNPSIVGIYIYMQPLIASWMGLYLGQQKLEWHHLVSGILIFTSVFMVSLPAKKKKF